MNIFIFLLVACFWGGSFIAIKPLVEIVPPMTAAMLRIGIAIAFLLVLFPVMKIPLGLAKKLRFRVWGIGLFAFAIPFAMLFWGERTISPGLAGVLNGTVPLFVFIFGTLFTPGVEVINFRKIAGLVLGLVGVVIIFLPKDSTEFFNSSVIGALAVLFMAISYAISVLLNRSLFTQHPEVHPFTNLFHQLSSGFVILVAVALVKEGWPQFSTWQPASAVWIPIIYLSVGSTSIAFVLFYKLIKDWGSVRAATVTYVIPPAALVIDFIWNRTVPGSNEMIGVVIITTGVVILNLPTKSMAKN